MAVKELVVCPGISPFLAIKQSRSRKLLSKHYQDEREFETLQMLPLSGLTAVVPGLFPDPTQTIRPASVTYAGSRHTQKNVEA